MLYRVLDDVLPANLQNQIEKTVFGMQFPWFHYANTNHASHLTQHGDTPQFTHGFMRDGINNSKFTQIPLEIIKPFSLGFEDLLRAKANILPWDRERFVHPAHTDDDAPHYVVIYYVNDADGATCFFQNGEIAARVEPKKGRILFFDGSIAHASSSPIETRFRGVVNINLKASVGSDRFMEYGKDS